MKKYKVKIQDKTNATNYIIAVRANTYEITTTREYSNHTFTDFGVKSIVYVFLNLNKMGQKLIIEQVE